MIALQSEVTLGKCYLMYSEKIQKYNGKVVVISGLKINFVLNWDRLRRPVSSHRHAYLFNP